MQLQQFNFNNNEIRVIDKNGEPWFIAKDVCDVLEHTNPSVAISRLDDDDKMKLDPKLYLGSKSNQEFWVVSESGLYNLVFTSNKKEAKVFKKWVTSEVLPTIRKTGRFKITDTRKKSIDTRNAYTDVLKDHGFSKPAHYIQVTLAQKKALHIDKKKKKNTYTEKELLLTTASEAMTMFHVLEQNLHGYQTIKPISQHVAEKVYENTIGMINERETLFAGLEALK